MVVTTDITADVNDIHPPNKKDVGRRLALWALAKDYGQDEVVYSGPTLAQTTLGGSAVSGLAGKVSLQFDHVGVRSHAIRRR